MTAMERLGHWRSALRRGSAAKFPWRDSALARRYLALGPRDRRAVNIALAAALAALVHTGVVAPIIEYRAAGVAHYLAEQSRLEWMRAHQTRARGTGLEDTPQAAGAGSSLLTLVDSTAKAYELSLTRYQPDAAGGVTVVIEGQPFNAILRWAERLRTEHGLHIATASVHGQAEAGHVNARFLMR